MRTSANPAKEQIYMYKFEVLFFFDWAKRYMSAEGTSVVVFDYFCFI